MQGEWRYQLRIDLSDELATVARRDAGDPALAPLAEVLKRHGAKLVCQYDACAGYVAEAEARGIDGYPLYAWTKATIEDPAKQAKYLKSFTLYLDGLPKAYPLETLAAERLINDTLGDLDVVVLGPDLITVDRMRENGDLYNYSAGAAVRAYERGGLTFYATGDPLDVIDEQGRLWRVTEEALLGPRGETLPRLGGHLAYWFGWYASFPQTAIFGFE